MQRIEQKGYTREQIINTLHGKTSPRIIKFRYDLLDRNDNKKAELGCVESGEVGMNSLALNSKRTAKFTLKEDKNIDWLNDRIQPFCMFRMPDWNWVEWSLGIFLLSSPVRAEKNGKIYRDVEAYDGLIVLLDDKFDSRTMVAAGTKYIDAVKAILQSAGITKINIANTDEVLRADKEFEIGTEKLRAINELLGEINYTSLWVNEYGYYTSNPYRLPSEIPVEYTYENNELSVLYNGMEEELDLFNVPNKFVVVQSNAETEPLTSIYENNNSYSVTSTVSRGRTIVDFREIENIASQAALDEYTQRIAYEASQVYGHIRFDTAIMPFHSYSDLLKVKKTDFGIDDKYIETNWKMKLETGAKMEHTVRKVVTI